MYFFGNVNKSYFDLIWPCYSLLAPVWWKTQWGDLFPHYYCLYNSTVIQKKTNFSYYCTLYINGNKKYSDLITTRGHFLKRKKISFDSPKLWIKQPQVKKKLNTNGYVKSSWPVCKAIPNYLLFYNRTMIIGTVYY